VSPLVKVECDGGYTKHQTGTRANLNYLDQLAKFHRQYGTNLNRFPSVDKRPLDLYKLKKAVEVRGGFDKVCKDKKWAEIGRDLGYSGKIMSSLSTSLKNSYQRWLHPYEEYLRTAKPGVQQQLEHENGGPYDTSPVYSPSKASASQHNTPAAAHIESPAIKASVSLNASLGPKEPILQPTLIQPVEASRLAPPPPTPGSGFTAVNAGGFSAVNAPSGFIAVNNAPQQIVKHEEDTSGMKPAANSQHQTTYNILPPNYAKSSSSGPSISNGTGATSNPLKRTSSHDSLNVESGSEGGDGDSGSGRRSKRIKKGMSSDWCTSYTHFACSFCRDVFRIPDRELQICTCDW
jgi:[histone H3]-trimethyl-L-lysine4 demethylase